MNTGPSGVRLEQEVTQAEIILCRREWRSTHSLSVWAHTDNQSSVYPQKSYSRGMIIVFISFPLWVLNPPTKKKVFKSIFKVASCLLSNTFYLCAHAGFYIELLHKSICLLSHKEAVMSVSFEQVNLTTCGSCAQEAV